ncbi:hypothetical protein B0H11DRAFT_2364996, partial [Mycena galericulata]
MQGVRDAAACRRDGRTGGWTDDQFVRSRRASDVRYVLAAGNSAACHSLYSARALVPSLAHRPCLPSFPTRGSCSQYLHLCCPRTPRVRSCMLLARSSLWQAVGERGCRGVLQSRTRHDRCCLRRPGPRCGSQTEREGREECVWTGIVTERRRLDVFSNLCTYHMHRSEIVLDDIRTVSDRARKYHKQNTKRSRLGSDRICAEDGISVEPQQQLQVPSVPVYSALTAPDFPSLMPPLTRPQSRT